MNTFNCTRQLNQVEPIQPKNLSNIIIIREIFLKGFNIEWIRLDWDKMNAKTSNLTYFMNPNQISLRVPSDLIRLIRIVMKTFYTFELCLCMDMLLIYHCINENDFEQLLQLESKNIHKFLITLKNEKFLKERCIIEKSDDEQKPNKQIYFYINYKMMVIYIIIR